MKALLGILSFAFYHVNKTLLVGVQRLYFRLAPKKATEWRFLSGEGLKRPLALPIVMTTGPRWNPHAIIAAVGPLSVQHTLRIDAPAAASSAKAWTVVVNAFPGLRTVASLGSMSGGTDSLQLAPGRYTLMLRYYEAGSSPRLPAIEIDGTPIVAGVDVPPTVNDFYKELKGHNGFYYLWLHYYISVILRYEKRLPPSFVRAEYLPVGNPETEFFYGALKPGERLSLASVRLLRNDHRIYVAVYNRASFPVFWCTVGQSTEELEPVEGGAYYLIRAHRYMAAESAGA